MSNPDTRTERFDGAPPGPWRFVVSPIGHSVTLISLTPMQTYVMGAVRYGMQGAQPTFLSGSYMQSAADLSTPEAGREHHADWYRVIDNPVAALIEAAPTLLAERDALRAERDALREALVKIAEWDHCTCLHCYGHPDRDELIEVALEALYALSPEAKPEGSTDA